MTSHVIDICLSVCLSVTRHAICSFITVQSIVTHQSPPYFAVCLPTPLIVDCQLLLIAVRYPPC